MSHATRWCVLGLAAAASLWVPSVCAQSDPGDTEELVALQKLTKKEFTDLTDKMVEVADLLADSDPASARAIRQAVSQAQAAFLAERMDEVAEHLTRGMDTAAARGGEQIVTELRRLLETLLYGDTDISERAERIRRWREMLERIDQMIEKQHELERTSHAVEHADELDRRMAAIGRELEDIVSEQEKLLDETEDMGEPDETVQRLSELRGRLRRLIARQCKLHEDCRTAAVNRLPIAAGLQEELAETAGSLAEDIRAAADDEQLSDDLASAGVQPGSLREASEFVASAGGEMSTGGEALSRGETDEADTAQEQAISELLSAEEKLTAAIEARSAGTPAGELAGRQAELAKRTEALKADAESVAADAGVKAETGNLGAAAEQMQNASEKLTENDAARSAAHQRSALMELRDQGYELAQIQRRIEQKSQTPTDSQTREQSDLADQARNTGERMSEGDDRAAPGGSDVDSAAGAMDAAAGKLSGGDCGGANPDQKEALDRLGRARDELSDAIAREQEMLQAEQLASIEQMLRQILTAQEGVSGSTRQVHEATAENGLTRSERLRLAELSDAEGAIAEDVSEVREMLYEEGSTVVFPGVLEEVHGELGEIQRRLAENDAGGETQQRQANVESDLRAMLEAVRDELSRRRREGGGGQCPGGGGESPLIPPVAELRMLRLLQLRIISRTQGLAAAAESGELSEDAIAERHKELAERQSKLRRMTQDVAESMEGPAGGMGPAGGGQ